MSEAFEFTQQPEEQPAPQPQEGPENGTGPEGENAPEEQEKKPPEDVFYWLNALTTALVCLVIVFTFFGRLTRVDGPSMERIPCMTDSCCWSSLWAMSPSRGTLWC